MATSELLRSWKQDFSEKQLVIKSNCKSVITEIIYSDHFGEFCYQHSTVTTLASQFGHQSIHQEVYEVPLVTF